MFSRLTFHLSRTLKSQYPILATHDSPLKPIRITQLHRPLSFQWREAVINLNPVPGVDEVQICPGLNDPAKSIKRPSRSLTVSYCKIEVRDDQGVKSTLVLKRKRSVVKLPSSRFTSLRDQSADKLIPGYGLRSSEEVYWFL